MAKILIVDDDKAVADFLAIGISGQGHEVTQAETLAIALRFAESGAYDAIFLDMHLPDGDGLAALQKFKAAPSRPEVVIITGMADETSAKSAIRLGAWDYLSKPCSIREVMTRVADILAYRQNREDTPRRGPLKHDDIIGDSPAMRRCLERLAEVSLSDVTVLITGETGTGKELFARAIHENGERSQAPFVVVDCTVLPEHLAESLLFGHVKGAFTGAETARTGLVQEAHGGTLFLDEIGELPPSLQKRFLRVLQERRFRPVGGSREVASDFRLIAATNRDLEDMAKRDQFRNDLYYRLKSMVIDLPSLNDRKDDLRALTDHYIQTFVDKYETSSKKPSVEFYQHIENYHWPGNVRELVNAMSATVAAAGQERMLYPKHLPSELRIHKTLNDMRKKRTINTNADGPLPTFREFRREAVRDAEREYLRRLMDVAADDFNRARTISGLGRSRLYALLREYRLSP